MEVGEFGWGEEGGSGGGHGLVRWIRGSVGDLWKGQKSKVTLSLIEANIIPVLIMIYYIDNAISYYNHSTLRMPLHCLLNLVIVI